MQKNSKSQQSLPLYSSKLAKTTSKAPELNPPIKKTSNLA